MTDTMKGIIKDHDNKFKYQLLSRLQMDCNYYLGYGNRSNNILWSGSEKDHIEDMRALYQSFQPEDRPEWLTAEQIEDYALKML